MVESKLIDQAYFMNPETALTSEDPKVMMIKNNTLLEDWAVITNSHSDLTRGTTR